jgi:hypothetical protein
MRKKKRFEPVTVRTRIALADDPDLALIKGVAMDIGKEVVAYVEVMYPQAIEHTSSTFALALRNTIYNEIIEAMKVTDREEVLARLDARKTHRRVWKAQWKTLRETDWDAYRKKRDEELAK